MRIAVDAMGGDYAPGVIVEGAVLAANEHRVTVVLVGDKSAIEKSISDKNLSTQFVDICHAPSVIGMDESPSFALRRKKDSSLRIATDLVKKKEANAVVSAGNTGASMAIAKVVLRPIKGVERPAISAVLPSLKGSSLLLDAGANVDCKPIHLKQFAIMGSIYAQDIMGIADPKIGLLNIGAERDKGNELTRESYELLEKSDINFIGNVEGKDAYNGNADVLVCDGFIGNIGLKFSEAVAETVTAFFREEVEKHLLSKLGVLLLQPSLRAIRKKIDYSEYGGAPLLGVNGVFIICHGSSSEKAIKNAVRRAEEYVDNKVVQHIGDRFTQKVGKESGRQA
jgi:glycerol-3-phosphate acyltransferase PlsX